MAGLSLVSPNLAHADDQSAAAEVLFLEGKALASEERWAEACPKFEAAYQLEVTLGAVLNLADCHERIGLIATAWSEWGEARDLANKVGDDRASFAEQRHQALAPRLPMLMVSVQNPTESLTIYRNDVLLDPAAFNVALPIDPGDVALSVRRGDNEVDRRTAVASEGQRTTIEIDLRAIDQAHPALLSPPKDDGGSSSVVFEAPPPVEYWNGTRIAGAIVSGVGLLGLASFGILEGVAIAKKSESDDSCVSGQCSPDGVVVASDAETLAEAGQWVGIASGVVFLVGATMFIFAPSEPAPQSGSVSVAPWVGPTGAGLTLGGRM